MVQNLKINFLDAATGAFLAKMMFFCFKIEIIS